MATALGCVAGEHGGKMLEELWKDAKHLRGTGSMPMRTVPRRQRHIGLCGDWLSYGLRHGGPEAVRTDRGKPCGPRPRGGDAAERGPTEQTLAETG